MTLFGRNALFKAAREGDLEAVASLVDSGADINEKNANSGETPLLVAAHHGHGAIVEWMLTHGADKAATVSGMNALHHAALRGRNEVVDLLLTRYQFDPNSRTGYGSTPLHFLAAHAPRTSDVVATALLIEHGATVDARSDCGTTPLMTLLLKNGADANARRNDGKTALMLLARFYGRDDSEAARWLIAHGADPALRDYQGYSVQDGVEHWSQKRQTAQPSLRWRNSDTGSTTE